MLDPSNMKEFADDNSKFDKRKKVSKRVENTVEKNRNCSLRAFLLFPHCFQKTITADK